MEEFSTITLIITFLCMILYVKRKLKSNVQSKTVECSCGYGCSCNPGNNEK